MPEPELGAADDWLIEHVAGADGPFVYGRISGGRSNLTYLVTCGDGRRLVLRRPPPGPHPPSAHDVLREAQILRGLAGSEVPVPEVLGECADETVLGAPFVVTRFVDGVVIDRPEHVVDRLPAAAARRQVGRELARTLAALHRVDPAAVGLATHHRDGYLNRQLARWHEVWRSTRTRPLDALERTHQRLAARVPPAQPAAIVHGDYKLENCILDPGGDIAAVVDWELSAVGDPLVDLGLLLAYWAEPDDDVTALEHPATIAEGFPRRSELAEAYLELAGRPADLELTFYEAFAWWKLACIVEGVYGRMLAGSMGTSDRPPKSFAAQAERLAAQAERLAVAL